MSSEAQMTLFERLSEEIEEDFSRRPVAEAVIHSLDEARGKHENRVVEKRWYQMETVDGVVQALRDGHKRILIVGPTGSGKTFTSKLVLTSREVWELCGKPADRPLRVLFTAHLDKLLAQAVEEFSDEPNVELIPQSAYSRIPDEVIEQGWDIVIIDEAHHEAMRSYQDQLEMMGNTPILGLSATPDRDDGKLVKFSAIVEPISRHQAVEEGYLARSEINTIVDEAGSDKRTILEDILRTYSHEMGKTLVFVRKKVEVRHLVEVLQELGYRVIGLLHQSKTEVTRILEGFDRSEYDFIVNCQKIDEGVDLVGCTDVVLGRQVGSRRLINQITGRTARPDSKSRIWEFVDPLVTKYTTKDIIDNPSSHNLIYFNHETEEWNRIPYTLY